MNVIEKNKILQQHLTEIKGAVFVKYTGLLELAHALGLQSIETENVILNEETGFVLFKATVKALVGKDVMIFTGYGDASPKNVSGMVRQHLIRVAETRAKARALRDLVGSKYVSAEELGG